jgi:hypothetical protein
MSVLITTEDVAKVLWDAKFRRANMNHQPTVATPLFTEGFWIAPIAQSGTLGVFCVGFDSIEECETMLGEYAPVLAAHFQVHKGSAERLAAHWVIDGRVGASANA